MTRKKIRFSDGIPVDDESLLACPSCNGFYTHQRKVEIFNRSEDAEAGTHVSVEGDEVIVNRDISGNPSGRRHGLIIYFECETCSSNVKMEIYQHKGNTFMAMDFDGAE